MEKLTWKILAIIFFVLFVIETTFFICGYTLVVNEEEMTAECYYNICDGYPDALLSENVCYCYDYDLLGEKQIVETEYMK